MPIINLNNKSLLREHPDKSPIDDVTFEKSHSFIFPGDETVLLNKISLPKDAGVNSMNAIVMKDVKTSIIAEKPNIFSNVFSKEFTATRSFDLDSIALSFNNSNLQLKPWGSDGYAPNLNYKTNRNFKLPLDDFRRQVNFFTKYNASEGSVGPELILNGDFATDLSHWINFNAKWSWDSGKAKGVNVGSGTDELRQDITPTIIGKTYRFKFDVVNYINGELFVIFNASFFHITANGSYSFDIIQTSTYTVVAFADNLDTFNGSIDNVSVKEVTSDSATWDYNFWFPILFRWEYWKALQNADSDFYDPLQPQNGQNQFWKNYSYLPFWKIKQKLELNLLVNSIATTLKAEYNLSNEALEINGYSANDDYTTRSIKTGTVSGIPSNSPAVIYGYQDTLVYGYFTKVTAYDPEEMSNFSAIIWIEPFEGAGITARQRASSSYPITTETCFKPIEAHLIADDGTDLGLIIDQTNGVTVLFNPTNNQEIICTAQIDYTKMISAFPGINKFTIYCRLYNNTILVAGSTTTMGTLNVTGEQFVIKAQSKNYVINGIPAGYTLNSVELPDEWTINTTGAIAGGSQTFDIETAIGSGSIIFNYINAGNIISTSIDVYSSAMKMGEEIKHEGCLFIKTNPIPDTPIVLEQNPEDCTFVLPVFADLANPTIPLNNDISDFYKYGNTGVIAISMILQKNTSICGTGSWIDKQTIIDSSLGSFFAFGKAPDFSGNSFEDDFGKRYTGLQLQWIKVLQAYGVGEYRMKFIYATIAGDYTEYTPSNYCLDQFRADKVEGTIRIETLNEGIRGTLNAYKDQIDYGTSSSLNNPAYIGWPGQIRLKGIFFSVKPSYVKEYNQYGDDEYNAFKPIINEQIPKYLTQIKPVPGWIDFYLSTNVLQADNILITDYNSKNRHVFVQTPVMDDSGIDVKDENFVNPNAIIELSLQFGQNSLRKRN